MTRPRFLSWTEISDHRDCPAYGFVRYREGVRSPSLSSMRVGTLTHAGVAAACRAHAQSKGLAAPGETSIEGAIRAACAEPWGPDKDTTIEEDAETAIEVTRRALAGLDLPSGRFEHVEHEGRACIERRFVIPVDDPEVSAYYTGGFVGKIDLALRDHEYGGRLALIDLKVSKHLDADLGLDPQLALYQHAMGVLGLWPELAWQYRISPAAPVAPEPLAKPIKGRRLSTKREGYITEETFRRACREVGDDPSADYYATFLEWIRNRKPWACALGGADRHTAATIFAEVLVSAREVVRRQSCADAARHFRSHKGGCAARCSLYNQCVTAQGTADLVRLVRSALEKKPTTTVDLDID